MFGARLRNNALDSSDTNCTKIDASHNVDHSLNKKIDTWLLMKAVLRGTSSVRFFKFISLTTRIGFVFKWLQLFIRKSRVLKLVFYLCHSFSILQFSGCHIVLLQRWQEGARVSRPAPPSRLEAGGRSHVDAWLRGLLQTDERLAAAAVRGPRPGRERPRPTDRQTCSPDGPWLDRANTQWEGTLHWRNVVFSVNAVKWSLLLCDNL